MAHLIAYIVVGCILFYFATKRNNKIAETEEQNEILEYKKQGLELLEKYDGRIHQGFDDVGATPFTLKLFKNKIEFDMHGDNEFISYTDIKNIKFISQSYATTKVDTKRNKSNTIKYGYVGAKVLENEPKTEIIDKNYKILAYPYNPIF